MQAILKRIRRIEIRTRKIVDELTGGAYHSVFKGRGMEFSEVRGYEPGDDVRAIDWNVTARLGHPYLKKFVEERELTVMMAVDISGSHDPGSTGQSKAELAAELVALLAFSAIRNNDRVGLLLFSGDTELHLPPRKGRRQVLRLVRELLAHDRRERTTNLKSALESVLRVTRRRSVVFLISDLLGSGYDRALAAAGRRHDLIGLRLVDPLELRLPAVGRRLVVEDAETGAVLEVPAGDAGFRRDFSVEAGAARVEQERLFRRAGCDLVTITNGQDVVPPLLRFFREREKRR
ncbi:MAG: DUF58 domain-containing protein [Lentisphaeria bacterium]